MSEQDLAYDISTDQLRAAVELSPVPTLWLSPSSLEIVSLNSAARKFFESSDQQSSTRNFCDYVVQPLPSFRRAIELLEHGELLVVEIAVNNEDSREFTLQRVHNCLVAVGKTARSDELKVDQPASDFDPLTGLRNRNSLYECLEAGIRRAEHDWGVLFIDLDNYKDVNDRWGHLMGDKVLAEFAEKLRTSARPSDLVFRYGGDEFVIVVNQIASEQLLRRVADRIRRVVSVEVPSLESTLVVKATLGCAMASPHLKLPEHILDAADRDMYRAKRRLE